MFSPFKMKMMLHFASPAAEFHFLATVAATRTRSGSVSRRATFDRYSKELLEVGLITWSNNGVHVATAKGRVFSDAVLSTPLPVQSTPVWEMPRA